MKKDYLKYIKYITKWPINMEKWNENDLVNRIDRILLQMEYIKDKNVFDEKFYLKNYPSVANLDITPIEHYFFEGFICSEGNGKNPNETFDTSFYYEKIKDHTNFFINPFFHYIFMKNAIDAKDDLKDDFDRYESFVYSDDVKVVKLDTLSKIELKKNYKILIHIHAYYVDLVEEIFSRFKNVPINLEFFVTTDSIEKKHLLSKILKKYNFKFEVVKVENIGRDVAPMYVELKERIKNYDFLLHLHTKKSPHLSENQWYDDLLNKLIFNENYIYNVLDLFERNKKIGLVMPSVFPEIRRFTAWNLNYLVAKKIVEKSPFDLVALEKFKLKFPVGNMFWARVDAIMYPFNMDLNYTDFPKEPIPVDGTIAHALERLICFVVEQEGYYSCAIEPKI